MDHRFVLLRRPCGLADVPQAMAVVCVFGVLLWAFGARASQSVMWRMEGQKRRFSGLSPTDFTPGVAGTFELNHRSQTPFSQGRVKWGLDLSAWAQTGDQYTAVRQGHTVGRSAPDDERYQRSLNMYEFYLQGQNVNRGISVTLGKRRVVWGSGFGANPTDLINARKQALDPGAQRRGAPGVFVDWSQENQTVSFAHAWDAEEDSWGRPRKFLRVRAPQTTVTPGSPSGGPRAGQDLRAVSALRYYRLVGLADVNFMLYRSHGYADTLHDSWRPGTSLSLMVNDVWEWHGEALLQKGQGRSRAEPACLGGGVSLLLRCVRQGRSLLTFETTPSRTDVRTAVLLGSRYTFSNDAVLNAEVLFQGEGYSKGEFRDFLQLGALMRQLPDDVQTSAGSALWNASQGLLRRWYVIASMQNFKLTEDWIAAANGIASLSDFSGSILGQLVWNQRQDLAWTWGTQATWAVEPWGTAVPALKHRVSEFELTPIKYRFFADFKYYF